MTLKNIVQKAVLSSLIGATALTGVGMASRASAGEQTVPIGGVYVSGAAGSEWHDQQLLRNTTDAAIAGDLYCVERSSNNHDKPGFDPATSPSIAVSLPANSTTIIDDAYKQITGGEGACALWLVTDTETNPIWRSRVYNQLEEGQNGMTITASRAEYSPAGTTLSDVLSGEGMRDGLFLESGHDGVSGYWKYANGANGNEVTIDQDLGPNKTFQWTGTVSQMLGFEPEAGAQLDYIIENGSANAYFSRTDNDTNDGAWNKFEAIANTIEPKIIGLDLDGNGTADIIDENGDGALDGVIDVSCTAPFNYNHFIIAEGPDGFSYFGNNLPGGMELMQGTGQIVYNPPCSDSGQVFYPSFYISGMDTIMEAAYRVGD